MAVANQVIRPLPDRRRKSVRVVAVQKGDPPAAPLQFTKPSMPLVADPLDFVPQRRLIPRIVATWSLTRFA